MRSPLSTSSCWLSRQTSGPVPGVLAIFLAFLVIEALYDWVLKIPFREKMDWRQLVPYVALHICSNYGFVVMTWRYDSRARGILLLALFVVQILANVQTHSRHPDGPGEDRPDRNT